MRLQSTEQKCKLTFGLESQMPRLILIILLFINFHLQTNIDG